MNFIKANKLFWTRIFDYSNSSSRKEFWLAVFGNVVVMLMLAVLLVVSLTCVQTAINPFSITMLVLFGLFCVIELLPSIALIIRRMHDIGKSGFYIFVLFVPIFGWIYYIYLVTRPSAEIPYKKT